MDSHFHRRTATPCHTKHCELTYSSGAGFVQHNLHTSHAHETCQNPIEYQTHYANPMAHPVTSRTIKSYKKLMHDPATAEVWQTAFGKDFGGMAQGCNKMEQRGTNSMFVMMHDEIMHALADFFFTYANPIIDYCPQKDDPHRI
jgi:hypothetical protein